jgi:signal transduction histidine kinase/CheY-like chemotaxis protein
VFSFFFIDAKIDGVEESLKRQGSNILVHLSPEIHLALAHQEKTEIKEALENSRLKYPIIHQLSVMNNEGQLIAGDPSPFALEELNQNFNVSNNFGSDASETLILQDAKNFYFLMKLDDIEGPHHLGFMILTIPTSEAYALEKKAIEMSIFLLVIMVIFYIFLTLVLNRYLSKPINLMMESAKKIQQGSYDTRLSFKSFTEFELLKNTWNRMEESIQHSAETLTQKIKEATLQLEANNIELNQARIRALEGEKTKAEFLANMSHEIRTPLSAIIGFTELILEENLSPVQRDYLETIQKSAANLLQILNDILDFSKIEAGKLSIRQERVVLNPFFEEIIRTFTPIAQHKKLNLWLQEHPHAPESIETDPLRLKQILNNLIGNALKFTEHGYVLIHVFPIPSTNRLRIQVTDTGCGLSLSDQQKLFQAFSQADTSTTRQHGGTGLGLIICKKLVQLLGGEIGLESQENQGSTFWIELPIGAMEIFPSTLPSSTTEAMESERSSTEKPTNAEKTDITSSFSMKNFRVLVVDDHPTNLKLLLRLLEKLDFSAKGVLSGKEALAWISANPVDVIFMDLQMPEMDGFSTTEKIRALPLSSQPKIFALTADFTEAQGERISKVGMDGVYLKPISMEALVGLFSQLLENPSTLPSSTIEKVNTARPSTEKLPKEDAYLFDEVTSLQLKELPHIYEALSTAKKSNDHETLIQIVHKFHGGLCYTTLDGLKEKAKETERALRVNNDSIVEELLIEIERHLLKE